jgi:hypothetical protein
MTRRRAWIMVVVCTVVVAAAVLTPIVFDISWK